MVLLRIVNAESGKRWRVVPPKYVLWRLARPAWIGSDWRIEYEDTDIRIAKVVSRKNAA